MAHYHYHRAIGRREDGHHGLFASGYIRGEKRTCAQTAVTKDFSQKSDVVFKACCLPDDVPTWVQDLIDSETFCDEALSDALWQRIDVLEKHPRAQLYFHDNMALPNDLPLPAAQALMMAFVREHIAVEGVFADVAIHWDEGNHHAHVLLPLRAFTEQGFGNKQRFGRAERWSSLRVWVCHLRQAWAQMTNTHLRACGIDARVDHRSYRDRGLDLLPMRKLGAAAHMPGSPIHVQKQAYNRWVCTQNYRRIEANPALLAHKLMQEHSVITAAHVQASLAAYSVSRKNSANTTSTALETTTLAETAAKVWAQVEAQQSEFNQKTLQREVFDVAQNHTHFDVPMTQVLQNPNSDKGEGGRERYTIQRAFFEEAESIRIKVNPALLTHKRIQEHNAMTNAQVQAALAAYTPRENSTDITSIALETTALAEAAAKVLAKVEAQQSAFSQKTLQREVLNVAQNRIHFDALMTQVLQSPTLINLGKGEDGRERYTTRRIYREEAEFVTYAHRLAVTRRHRVPKRVLTITTLQSQLSKEQRQALAHLAKSNDLSLLVGRAGTGKSTLLHTAARLWEASGYDVIGMSVSGVATRGLAQTAKISAHTVAHFRSHLRNGVNPFSQDQVLILDEAGMSSVEDLSAIVQAAQAAGAKLVLVGDAEQLQPIGRGAPFRALAETIGFAALSTIYRQQDPDDRHATAQLAQGGVATALSHYANKQAVAFASHEAMAVKQLMIHWRSDVQAVGLAESVMLAFENKTVASLNQAARTYLLRTQRLNPETSLTFRNEREQQVTVTVGERLLCLKPDKTLGLVNGEFVTVEAVADQTLHLRQDHRSTVLKVPLAHYRAFDYGYAVTVHKAQGVSKQRVGVLISGWGWTKHLAYVALSRHREKVRVVVNGGCLHDMGALCDQLSQGPLKDNVLDYPVSFGIRRGFCAMTLIQRCVSHLCQGQVRDAFAFVRHYQEARLQLLVAANAQVRATSKAHELACLVAQVADYHRRAAQWFGDLRPTQAAWRDHQCILDQRGALAKVLLSHWEEVKTAAIQNGLTAGRLRHFADHFDAKNQVIAYLNAAPSARTALAIPIARNLKRCWPALLSYTKLHRLDLQETVAQLHRQARTHFFKEVFPSLLPEEQALAQALARFHSLHRRLQTYRRHFAGQPLSRAKWHSRLPGSKPSFYRHLTSHQRHCLLQWTQQRDALGVQLLAHRTLLGPWLKIFNVSMEQLTKASRAEQKRTWIRQWLTHPKDSLPFQQQCQALLANPKDYGAILSEIPNGWTIVRQGARQLDLRRKRFTYSSSERQALALWIRYRNLNRQVGQAWARAHRMRTQQGTCVQAVYRQYRFAAQLRAQRILLAQDMLAQQVVFSSLEPEVQVDWDKVQRQAASKDALQAFVPVAVAQAYRPHFFAHTYPNLSHDARERLDAVRRFVQWERRIQMLWHKGFGGQPVVVNPERGERLSVLRQAQKMPVKALHLTSKEQAQLTQALQIRDALGAYLLAHSIEHERYQLLFGVSPATLARAQQSHQARQEVVAVVAGLDDSLGAGHRAIHLAKDNQRYLKEIPDGWRQVHRARQRYAAACLLVRHRTLRLALQTCNNYQSLVQQTGQAYRRAFALIEGGGCDTAVARAFAMAQCWRDRRCQAAQTLLHHREQLEPFNSVVAIHWARVEQQASMVIAPVASRHLSPISALSEVSTNVHRMKKMQSLKPQFCAKKVQATLEDQAESFYTRVLGPPDAKSGHTWRYGSKGSLMVNVGGERLGTWYSFESGIGGGPLNLLMCSVHGYGLPFQEALAWGADMAGLASEPMIRIPPKRIKNTSTVETTTIETQSSERQKRANFYVKNSCAIEGTLGEQYLREHRHIRGSLAQFRFHPHVKDPDSGQSFPAVLLAARNAQGMVTACQTILLHPGTAQKADVKVVKRTRGVVKGSAGAVHLGGGNQVILAEGPETAASLIEAAPDANIYVTFGNAANAQHMGWLARHHQTDTLLFAADNDGSQTNSQRALQRAARQLQQEGIRLQMVIPECAGQVKCDFNDLLKAQGVEAVKSVLAKPVLLEAPLTASKDPSLSLEEEWKQLGTHSSGLIVSMVQLKKRMDCAKKPEQKEKFKTLLLERVKRMVDESGTFRVCQALAPKIMDSFVSQLPIPLQRRVAVTLDLRDPRVLPSIQALKEQGVKCEFLELNYARWQKAQRSEDKALWMGKFLEACRGLCERDRARDVLERHAPFLFVVARGLIREQGRGQGMEIER